MQTHDIWAHLVFGFIGGMDAGKFVPDKGAFREVVNDLKALKTYSEAAGTATAGPLRVHPGLQARVPGFADRVKAFITRRVSEPRLMAVAFMGLAPRPQPWVFYAMGRQPDGTFARVGHPVLSGDGGTVYAGRRDARHARSEDDQSAVGQGRQHERAVLTPRHEQARYPRLRWRGRPLHRDIPDIIANPALAHFRNTDCVSCHSESARRQALKIPAGDATFRYAPPAGISGVDQGHLPQSAWNVRNLGWFPSFGKPTVPTVTERTANEAAESAEVINREYLAAPQPTVNTVR